MFPLLPWKLDCLSLVFFLMMHFKFFTLCEIFVNDVVYDYETPSVWSKSEILKATLMDEDFFSNMKILPDGKDIIWHLKNKEKVSLVFAIARSGGVTLSLSPCSGLLKWELLWRPFPNDNYETLHSKEAGNTTGNATFPKSQKDYSITSNKIFPVGNRSRRSLKKNLGHVQINKDNFSVQAMQNPTVKRLHKNGEPLFEVHLNHGEGNEPWIFSKESAQTGLYIIKIQSLSEKCQFNAIASASSQVGSSFIMEDEMKTFRVKENYKKHSIILSWNSRFIPSKGGEGKLEKLYCLAVSSMKFYSSLCAAKELQKSYKILAPQFVDESLILGCTKNSFYNLPVTENFKYFISLWQKGSLVPFIQAIVRPKSHRKSHRLKPGKMSEFTLTNGGYILAKYNVKKNGIKLHVSAVSCYGGVKVIVLAGKERVAMAKGREALHLTIRRVPKAKLTIKVSPIPPIQALYRVYLVVTHSARKLPIPRLPKRVSIKAIPLSCISAKISWATAPGSATYCVVLQKHPSGRPPEIRPPLQCGWEEVIRRKDFFDYVECCKGEKEKRQYKIFNDLPSNVSYLVNVLVRHKVTGKTLTLAPTMLTLPSCGEELKPNKSLKLNHRIFQMKTASEA